MRLATSKAKTEYNELIKITKKYASQQKFFYQGKKQNRRKNKKRTITFSVYFLMRICQLTSSVLYSKHYSVGITTARYLKNCTPSKIARWLGLGFVSRLGLVLGLGVNQTIVPEENSPPG